MSCLLKAEKFKIKPIFCEPALKPKNLAFKHPIVLTASNPHSFAFKDLTVARAKLRRGFQEEKTWGRQSKWAAQGELYHPQKVNHKFSQAFCAFKK